MFKDDTSLETVLARYKLGLDHIDERQFEAPIRHHPRWQDRILFNLGKTLIVLGSRLQQRHTYTNPAVYRSVYPAR